MASARVGRSNLKNFVKLSQGEMASTLREASPKPRSWQLEPRLTHLEFISLTSEVELVSARRVPTGNSTCPRHRSSSQAGTKFKRRDDVPRGQGDRVVSPPTLTQTPPEKRWDTGGVRRRWGSSASFSPPTPPHNSDLSAWRPEGWRQRWLEYSAKQQRG